MNAYFFDALDYFEKLKAAGVPEAQARVQADTLRDFSAHNQEFFNNDVSTKRDLKKTSEFLCGKLSENSEFLQSKIRQTELRLQIGIIDRELKRLNGLRDSDLPQKNTQSSLGNSYEDLPGQVHKMGILS